MPGLKTRCTLSIHDKPLNWSAVIEKMPRLLNRVKEDETPFYKSRGLQSGCHDLSSITNQVHPVYHSATHSTDKLITP
jgi:hypothetical protein